MKENAFYAYDGPPYANGNIHVGLRRTRFQRYHCSFQVYVCQVFMHRTSQVGYPWFATEQVLTKQGVKRKERAVPETLP